MQAFLDAFERALESALTSLGYVLGQIPTVLSAILVVIIFSRIAHLVVHSLGQAGRISPRLDPSLALLLRQLISVGIVTLGVAIGFSMLGMNLTTIAATFGVAGLIVGFALKDMLENFIAGILILWRRPFEIADQIKVGEDTGTVRDINFRTTTLQTPDGVAVLIPNAQIFNKPVYNLTHYGTRRTTVVVRLSVRTDLSSAQRLIVQAVAGIDGVLTSPPPEALLLGSPAEGHEVHLRYWTLSDILAANQIESRARAAVLTAIADARLIPERPEPVPATAEAERQGTSGDREASPR